MKIHKTVTKHLDFSKNKDSMLFVPSTIACYLCLLPVFEIMLRTDYESGHKFEEQMPQSTEELKVRVECLPTE